MATKRKRRKNRGPQPENLAEPTKFRLQHGDFTEPVRESDPDTGLTVVHRRAIDLLGRMLGNGTISAEMREAGDAFHADFRRAALDHMPAANLLRSGGGTGLNLTERIVHARTRIAEALEAVGGPASPAGSCLWHVVGCESSVREWAAQQGWAGRTMGHTQAQGVLIAALGTLAAHRAKPRARRRDKMSADSA
ncbi:hypothetical protein KTR66_09800 [Roseococcus sp. SDR]|uniref:DUF6456 domain-containing protein n=1 Tax=Roseococcus sp. SDR TaxID=2835532 RepID=UPI001BD02AAD|nr:DUF6456 domain-containing protein [Roseococcus sp. SDR]MBS7790290.1 hypothetical protein [Roseococcus sp. SDR]MBV1845604.1 hypothetical protein [Roseococcus sp. SDR]